MQGLETTGLGNLFLLIFLLLLVEEGVRQTMWAVVVVGLEDTELLLEHLEEIHLLNRKF
jgi:hypothetical protein